VLQGHKNSVISIDLSPVGNMLATGSGDWQARICEWFLIFSIRRRALMRVVGTYKTE
jgi:WD40 repeat protein